MCHGIFSRRERPIAEAVAEIAFGNPFLPERIAREREVLDHDFLEAGPVIRVRSDANYDAMFPNVAKLHRLAETLAEAAVAAPPLRSHGDRDRPRPVRGRRLLRALHRHLSLVHEPVRTSMGSPSGAALSSDGPRSAPTLRRISNSRTDPSLPTSAGASVRGLFPDRTCVPLDLREHRRRFVADSWSHGSLAIDLHA